ncbi:MotE family protein [Magnetococcus sp. PR-3]|uniref:MotE family protein n=1 Tax=Magnetococcus sp. PR-3 TaxID=3120355 RepID=UPI002FCE51DF
MNGIKRVMAMAVMAFGLMVSPVMAAQDQNGAPRDPVDLLKTLEKRQVSLEARAKALDLKEQEIKRMGEMVDKRLKALTALREEVRQDILEEKNINTENIARLARIYSAMKPKVAAKQLKDLERTTAVKILKVLKEKVAAKIFDKMDPMEAVPLADAIGMTLQERRMRRIQ